jgi:hypothetical protein
MEIAGDPTRLVEDLVDEAEDLLQLRSATTVCEYVRRLVDVIPDDNDRQ